MEASSNGIAPDGFRLVLRADPKPDTDGVIRGASPLEVEFDACGSTPDAGKTLYFLFDFNFDNVADVVGTGDACHQSHKYNVKSAPDGKGEAIFETNICVVNADPRAHAPGAYYSCRTYRVGLPRAGSAKGVSCDATTVCGANEVGLNGVCYYLDGSGGECDPGFSLAPQSVLNQIASCFEGLTYKHQVSGNCCIYNSEPDEDWGMLESCNEPGPFPAGEPGLGLEGCTDQTNFGPTQLTFCGGNAAP